MRILRETPGLLRRGVIGVVLALLVVGAGQCFSTVPIMWAQPVYYAEFADAAGIKPGDAVRLFGMDTGKVNSVQLRNGRVIVEFTLDGNAIGADSRVAIQVDTLLGRKNIEIESRGSRDLEPRGTLPLEQSVVPYEIYEAFSDATDAVEGWNTESVKEALNVLSDNVVQASPHLSAALDGVARFSDTIGKRDEQLKELLAHAREASAVLGDGAGEIERVLAGSRELFATFNQRSDAISELLQRVTAVSVQVRGFLADNPNLATVLQRLEDVTGILVERRTDLQDVLSTLSRFSTSLAESVASGPYFKVMVVNLLPGNLVQPFIDAAFKKRGIDPQVFWRDAGLPAFRFPDPTAEPHDNGAPAPAPVPMEGVPGNPGPAVPPGTPCSYTPPQDGLPAAADPLPCARIAVGPFGPIPGGPPPPPLLHRPEGN